MILSVSTDRSRGRGISVANGVVLTATHVVIGSNITVNGRPARILKCDTEDCCWLAVNTVGWTIVPIGTYQWHLPRLPVMFRGSIVKPLGTLVRIGNRVVVQYQVAKLVKEGESGTPLIQGRCVVGVLLKKDRNGYGLVRLFR